MIYIIDANNLAGKLNLLEEKDFDKKLIEIIKNLKQSKANEIYLIFDSADKYGDKYQDGNVIIIYTPKDSYYKSADDKIIEVADELVEKEEASVITDDLELINTIQEINGKRKNKIKLIKATYFAEHVVNKADKVDADEDDRNLTDEEMDDINNELLKIWK